MKKSRKRLAVFLFVLLLGLLTACNEAEDTSEDEEEKVTPVETAEVTKEDMNIEKVLYGRTSPKTTTPVMLQAPGEVEEWEVENGDQVEEDDIIAKIATPQGKQNIRASKDGEIANIKASEGELASTEEPLAVITDMETMLIEFDVTSDAHSLFKKEDTLTAVIDDKEYDVEVTSVDKMPNDKGLYPVKVSFDNEEENILPGQVAAIHVSEKKLKDALTVPTAAVVEESEEAFVYVIKDNKAVKHVVNIQETKSDKTAIKGDVKAGDQVVISGQLTLSDGNQVKVLKGE